ncbi:hypothetical protein ABT168_15385 [Streptomyces sp. NPDC001793]|uniref:hypothetical protein n=1 Tax=Streptomyces sp. NPDC001793 TaxID=3154657 RepID=UPI00332084F6
MPAIVPAVLRAAARRRQPRVPPSEALDALVRGGSGSGDAAEVVRYLRLPRTLIGLPVGVLTAAVGAPYPIWLIIRGHRSGGRATGGNA